MKKIQKINNRSRLFRIILLSCLVFSVGSELFSQETSVIATVDTNKLLIGDQTYFRITIESKHGITLEWPVISDSLFKGIEIIKRFSPDTISRVKDAIKIQEKLLITSFDSGQHDIPALQLLLTDGLRRDSILTKPISITVNTIQLDTAKAIFDIKKPYGAPVTLAEIIPYIGIGLAAVLFILLIIYIFRRLKKQKPLIPTRILSEPPHVTALRNLDILKEEKLWQQGQVKQYYTKLTDIIRAYIESRFTVPAMEQTSDEILTSLKKIELEDEACFSALREIVTLADLVKFAKALPLPNENESNILNAYLFVNHTKAIDEPLAENKLEVANEAVGKEVSHG